MPISLENFYTVRKEGREIFKFKNQIKMPVLEM